MIFWFSWFYLLCLFIFQCHIMLLTLMAFKIFWEFYRKLPSPQWRKNFPGFFFFAWKCRFVLANKRESAASPELVVHYIVFQKVAVTVLLDCKCSSCMAVLSDKKNILWKMAGSFLSGWQYSGEKYAQSWEDVHQVLRFSGISDFYLIVALWVKQTLKIGFGVIKIR